jgi:signal transduction histidine kinase/ligand-binding sensor domain-containing protein
MCSAAKGETSTTHLRLPLLWLLISLFVSSPARAVDPNNHISQYAHTAWRIQDGMFDGNPRVLAQTTDGYVWIGTTAGLVRFDGVRFVPWAPPDGEKLPSQRINSLLGGTDGSLWIGTAVGLSRWQNNQLTNYQDQRGVVTAIVEDADATIWINLSLSATKNPLCKVDTSGMRCYGTADGIPPGAYWALAKDRQGNFWIGREQGLGLIRWRPDSHDVYPLKAQKNTDASVSSIAVQTDGSLWTGIDVRGPGLGLQRFVDGIWKPFLSIELDGSKVSVITLLLDRENALWVGTTKNGVYRIYRDKVDHFGSAEGLSSDYVYKLFEDREGNVWVATTKGIDNFRELRVVSFSTHEGLSAEEVDSVFAARDGGVWVGGPSSMDLLRNGHVSFILAERRISGGATSFFEDHAGRLWVGIDNTLLVYESGKFRPITSKNGSPIGMVYSITEDTENNIWVESQGPLTRIRDFKVEEEFPSAQVPAAYRVVADPKKGIWLGLANGDLARYQDGRTETFHFQHAVKSRVEQLTVNPDGSVLGTTASGLVGWRSGKQVTLSTQNGLPCDITYDSILDAQGDLWIYAQCGLIEIKKEELKNWWDHPDSRVQSRLFDVFDGAQPGRAPFGGATRSPDGRLWFASSVVLQTVDPDHLALNSVLPPVHVEGIVADHRNYLLQDGLRLPPLTRDVEVDYTALSFMAPQKVRFRYKLEGRDTGWQDPGIRRQAFYTDLRPGKYTFRVIACNNDGVWNEEGATLNFAVSPAWYQTNRFLVLCLFTTILMFWALYRLRVRQVARTISARFDERLAERTRLAREIHDTLVQTIQGSKMVADDALDEATDFPRMRQAMERLSVWLGQATDEGRAALNSLRTSTTQTNDLAESFRRALNECRIQGFPDTVFVAEGKATEMHPIVRDEIYRIGYEAIRNACQHSEGTRLEVQLSYLQDLTLRITDNGKGIASDVAAQGKDGHYGLQGMRERAGRISGSLSLKTSPDSGTEIELIVPGRIVFRSPRSSWSPLFTRMKELFRGPVGNDDTN